MVGRRFSCAFLFALLVSVVNSKDDGPGMHDDNPHPVKFTIEELNERIQGLFDDRPERPDGPDFDMDFEALFGELDGLVDGMPDDFQFKFELSGPGAGHPRHAKVKDNKCMNNPSQFNHFLRKVSEVLQELREEYTDDLHESTTSDDVTTESVDVDSTDNMGLDDSSNNSTEDLDDPNTTPSTALDSMDDSLDSTDQPEDSSATDQDTDDAMRRKRDMALPGFDLDEVLDRLEDDDVECLVNFVGEDDEEFLCRRFAHRSSGIFAKLLTAGADCEDVLLSETYGDDDQDDVSDEVDRERDGDDVDNVDDKDVDVDDATGVTRDADSDENDDDDRKGLSVMRHRLDESHQMAILNRLRNKPIENWTEGDVNKIMRLAPDVIDEDFLDDLPEMIFKKNMRHFGRMANRRGGNPRLRYALRDKLDDLDLKSITAEDIRDIGAGLLSLRLDQIDELDGDMLLDADLDDLFDIDDDVERRTGVEYYGEDDNDMDDDDDDDDDGLRLAIGRRMKQALRQPGHQHKVSAGALRFLYDDLDFVNNLDPDDLLENLADIRDLDYGDVDAGSVFARMSQASMFPSPGQMSGRNLTAMGHLLRGMAVTQLAQLNREAIEEALDDLRDVDFDDDQAEEILEAYFGDDKRPPLEAGLVRHLGRLARGFPTEELDELENDDVKELLDDLHDLDLGDAQKKIVTMKALAGFGNKIHPKLFELDDFAQVLSVDDLDDMDDEDIKLHLNVSSKVNWRLPQAAILASMYKKANGAKRLRTSDLAVMGHVAKGLLPEDLDDMAESQDDVLDLAEELKDVQEELTSSQIDELVESFREASGLDDLEVTIDGPAALQGAHVLAYMKPELFEKLEFTKDGKAAFLMQVGKMSTKMMSREHVQFLAETMLDMMEDIDSGESTSESSDDRQSRRLRSLGMMAMGISPSQIRSFGGQAVIDNLDILRLLPLTRVQSKAVLDMVEDGADDWRCRSDVLARVGPLLQHHDDPFGDEECPEELMSSFSAVMKGLERRRERIQERIEEGFAREDDTVTDEMGEKRLVSAMLAAVTQNTAVIRRRRAANQGPLTCDIVKRLRSSANLVDATMLTDMKDEEFKNCLSTLGAISDWPKETLDALANKLKMVYKGVDTWTNEVIRRAGAIVAGLTPAEIGQLQLTGVDAMNSVGKHAVLTTDQLKAGFKRWLSLATGANDITKVSDGEFASLSEFVCGLGLEHVRALPELTFKRSLDVIGHSKSCTQQIRQAYADKILAIYGSQIGTWQPAVVGDMGHLLGALSDSHIKHLTNGQLSLVTPSVIQNLPQKKVAAMSTNQLVALSTNQANSVTQAQYEMLTSGQKDAITKKATVSFTAGSSPDGKDNGVAGMDCTVLVVTAALLICTLV